MSEKNDAANAGSSASSEAVPPRTLFCRELRSKGFYLLTSFPTTAEQYMDDSNHCWCYLTQEPIGPDGNKVNPHKCVANRTCYRSPLAEIA